MNIKKEIRVFVRKEIKKILEAFEFEVAASEQLAKTSSIHKLPRKGISDSINNYNLISVEQDKKKSTKKEIKTPDTIVDYNCISIMSDEEFKEKQKVWDAQKKSSSIIEENENK